jgi:hypothetical protein
MSVTVLYTAADFLPGTTDVNPEQIRTYVMSLLNIDENAISVSVSGLNLSIILYGITPSAEDLSAITAYINAYVYSAFQDKTAIIRDVKTVGTNAGTFTAGAWRTRTLNTLEGDVNFVSLSSNRFTLQPGSYTVAINAPACNVESHQCRLQCITDASTAGLGSAMFSSGGNVSISTLSKVLNISSTKVYEVQHQCSKSVSDIGLGRATGFDVPEVYTEVSIKNESG